MPSRNTFFKPSYSEQERNDLIQWFDEHFDELPPKLFIDPSIATNDLPTTVRNMVSVLRNQNVTRRSTFCGYMSTLIRVRELIQNPNT